MACFPNHLKFKCMQQRVKLYKQTLGLRIRWRLFAKTCVNNSLIYLSFRDAEDAVHARDGYDYDGYRLRVEFPRGGGPSNNFRGGRGAGDSGRGGRGEMSNSRGRGPPARRSQYRVLVSGLPPSGSWQDLKDHMREAGDVCFADVYKDGTGVVEFLRHDDMKYAVKKLDDSRFRSHEVRFSPVVLIHETYKYLEIFCPRKKKRIQCCSVLQNIVFFFFLKQGKYRQALYPNYKYMTVFQLRVFS